MAGDAECEASCVGLALAVCAYVIWVHTFAKCTKHDAKLKVAIELCMTDMRYARQSKQMTVSVLLVAMPYI